jgi:hypothetical protein
VINRRRFIGVLPFVGGLVAVKPSLLAPKLPVSGVAIARGSPELLRYSTVAAASHYQCEFDRMLAKHIELMAMAPCPPHVGGRSMTRIEELTREVWTLVDQALVSDDRATS